MRDSAALAVELEGDPATPWYALARVAFGFSRYLSGEPGVAEGPLEQAISSEPAIPLVRMLGLSVLSLVAVDTGQLARAREPARVALSLGARGGVIETQASALAYLAAGAVYAARGELQRPAASSSTRSSSARLRQGSARGPRWRPSSAWRRCCWPWATVQGLRRCSTSSA